MRNILFVIVFSFYTTSALCVGYIFRIELKDKGNPPYTIENPSEYLSEKSIERRLRQGLSVDETDLPIDPLYLDAIKATGASIKAVSKWVKTVTVYLPDNSAVPALNSLSFVNDVYCVWKGNLPQSNILKLEQDECEIYDSQNSSLKLGREVYGSGYEQINMLNADMLHEAGFKGEGMSIAILDVGFFDSDKVTFFNQERIKEVKNFTHEQGNPLRIGAHGTYVLSCMLSNTQGRMVGTAPEADYYLFKTEVDSEEFLVEEDYWVAALEYADSIGVDVVNTSLGYFAVFDDPTMNHTVGQLDGYTVPASRAASMAGNKGMLLFNAAGNEGNNFSWKKICVPGDADNIITVGAVNYLSSIIAAFSSRGPTADGRVKPDLCAVGESAALVNPVSGIFRSHGTSFASPVLAGAGACLWQAMPHKSSKEMIAIMKSVGDRYTTPDNSYGYGIPDLGKAYTDNAVNNVTTTSKLDFLLFFDTMTNCLHLRNADNEKTDLQIFNSQGQLLARYNNITTAVDVSNLNHGIYIARIKQGEKQVVQKFIKW